MHTTFGVDKNVIIIIINNNIRDFYSAQSISEML